MHLNASIRKETADDIPGIRAVVEAAFGRPGEADLVDALRRAGVLTLSAIADIGGRIIGHVAFSPVTIEGRHPALALAPLAVAPDSQGQGIGSALIRWGLDECRRLGHGLIIVLGSPAYYRRFGFKPASEFGIVCPFLVPADDFMAIELSANAARDYRGTVRYRPEFALVD